MAALLFLVAILPVMTGATIAGDLSQFVYKPTRRQLYLAYRYRVYVVGASAAIWFLGLIVHLSVQTTSVVWLVVSLGLVTLFSILAYVAVPHTLFTGERSGQWVSAAEADSFLLDDTDMLAVEVNGDARASPLNWMTRLHFWEDTVGGELVNFAFCPLSNAITAIKPEVNGQKMHLVVPSQWENNLMLYDYANDNLIQQIGLKITDGTHQGAALTEFPTQIMTWGAWKALHPQTQVLYSPPTHFISKAKKFIVEDTLVG